MAPQKAGGALRGSLGGIKPQFIATTMLRALCKVFAKEKARANERKPDQISLLMPELPVLLILRIRNPILDRRESCWRVDR